MIDHLKYKECKESGEKLKYKLRRCEVEAMDKIAKDLENAARRHNSKILYWQVNKLDFSQLSIGTGHN